MLPLRTSANFTVVRQIANHLDTDTNYVRAVIRNAYTDAIITTLDLTDRGAQRFSANWKVPQDPSGEGFYVSIVTSVYSDSGYTTKNQNYGDEETTYLVTDRDRVGGGPGMVNSGVDSRTVRRIFQEEFAKAHEEDEEEPEEVEEEKPVDFTPVISAIIASNKDLKAALKPVKPEKVDLKPVQEQLQQVLTAIAEKEVTEPTDLAPVLEKLDDSGENNELMRKELVDILQENAEALAKAINATLPELIADLLSKATFKIAPTTATMEAPKKKEQAPVPFDISKLSS
jgi:hypothetical protein